MHRGHAHIAVAHGQVDGPIVFAALLTSASCCPFDSECVIGGWCSDRIFILGPSHHHYTKICELSRHSHYATPVSSLQLDTGVISALRATRCFSDMSPRVDEEEHSIEMQLPFIAHVMRARRASRPFTIVPILVGSLNAQAEAEFAKILAPYFADTSNLFVISSDFCHWGSRFSYTYRDDGAGDIHDSIERLDRRGMDLIEKKVHTRSSRQGCGRGWGRGWGRVGRRESTSL